MQYQAMLREITNLILTSDPKESDIRTLYEAMQPHIQPLADWLRVARVEIHIAVEPNIYELDGDDIRLSHTYFPDADGLERAMVLNYPKLSNAKGTATVYPRRGCVWSEEDRRHIEAIGKLLVIEFSRSSMIRRQRRAPFVDMLTGLTNNPGVAAKGTRLERKYSMGEYAGCFINLKNFKYINQHLGNADGDAAIREYALALYHYLDAGSELAARLGGDNFFVLIHKARLEDFLPFASAQKITLHRGRGTGAVSVGAWIGVYEAKEGDKVLDILTNASFACENAKHAGQAVSYFDPAAMERSLYAKQISQSFPEALSAHELIPLYQPKVRLQTGELYGCEALVRWQKDGELIPPSEFVPMAESAGLSMALDIYMLEAVCQDIRHWLDEGLEPACVSVNYSQRDFANETLIEDTMEILNRYGVEGKYLEIEITESSFFENHAALENFIEAMHANGIKVSLDDFGTGYSSLNMFKNLNVDTVKLDKGFFDNLAEHNESDRVVLRSIADMLSQLHKTAISEGVETPEQYDFAKEIGCEIIQGYYFDRPLTRDEFAERLRTRYYKVN